jgi:hypothetical protein
MFKDDALLQEVDRGKFLDRFVENFIKNQLKV